MNQLTDKQKNLINSLLTKPYKFGKMLGFTKLTELHNEWIIDMIIGKEDETLQSHRGSYKTTCVSIALSLIILLFPNDKTMFARKTDSDIKEVIQQVKKILQNPITQEFCRIIWNVDLQLMFNRADSIQTNLAVNDPRGTPQLYAMGTQGSITGKHFDRIFTDDIVNVNDRVSKAERERTKMFYQELQNVKNRGGRIFNTGTPWHEEDCFTIMPKPKVYDCYNTGLISSETLQEIRNSMTASLFAANYELRHIASDDIIFENPQTGADPSLVEQGKCHVDASYGGEDSTAFTICAKRDGKYYVLGKLWSKHIDDCEDEIIRLRKAYNCNRISCEDNGDKGYLSKQLKSKGERTHLYHENMNKYLKITSYLKGVWKDVIFVIGTDEDYIKQITNYTEDAEHDDAPDSLASMIRELCYKKDMNNTQPSSITQYFI